MRPLILICLVLFSGISSADNIKSALKYYEKKDFERAEEQLLRVIDKEEFAPGAYYLYSLLYTNKKFRLYSTDSAYASINLSLAHFDSLDNKELDRLDKQGITRKTLIQQQKEVELLAFEETREKDEVESYVHFLKVYNTSQYAANALFLRDQKAFNDAEKEKDYRLFKRFMEQYPDSEFYEKAENNYERLYYYEKTADQTLVSYVTFLEEHPTSFYRDEAATHIYDILTATNTTFDLENFLLVYGDTKKASQVINRLYHLYSPDKRSQFYENANISVAMKDSVKRVETINLNPLVATFLEDGYAFMTNDFNHVILNGIDSIPSTYLCHEIQKDYLIISKMNRKLLINRQGKIIYSDDFIGVQELIAGWLKVNTPNGVRVVHKSSLLLSDLYFEDVDIMGNGLIKFKLDGKWGIRSITDQPILKANYDEIFSLENFVVLVKGNRLGVTSKARLLSTLDQEKIKINLEYEDVELINEKFVLCFKGDKETVLNENLEKTIELKRQNIYSIHDKWYVKDPDGYTIFEEDFDPTFNYFFEDLRYNEDFVSLKRNGQWSLFHLDELTPIALQIDSVQLLGANYAQLFSNDSVFIFFNDSTVYQIPFGSTLSMVSNEGDLENFLEVGHDSKTVLFSFEGDTLFSSKFTDLNYLGDSLFIVSKGNYKGVINKSGQVIIDTNYEAIAFGNNENILLVRNEKFGNYNLMQQQVIATKYSSKPILINDSLLAVETNGSYFLLDEKGEKITNQVYEEVKRINDKTIGIRVEDKWSIKDVVSDSILVADLDDLIKVEKGNNTFFRLTKDNRYGIFSTKYGEILHPVFDNIRDIGVQSNLFKTELFLPEAEAFLAVFYDQQGNILKKQLVDQLEYDKFFCLN
jgi:tetratricopeptide (TPR) repeat protein